jgi:hypothetical protein
LAWADLQAWFDVFTTALPILRTEDEKFWHNKPIKYKPVSVQMTTVAFAS